MIFYSTEVLFNFENKFLIFTTKQKHLWMIETRVNVDVLVRCLSIKSAFSKMFSCFCQLKIVKKGLFKL